MGMKREEFMKYAEREIDNAFRGQKNRMMNLVEQAWAEGKRNAEIDGVASIVKGVMEKLSEEKNQEMYEGVDGKMYPKDW